MAIENVDGFDFAKDFTNGEMYEMLKVGILHACEKSAGYSLVDKNIYLKSGEKIVVYEENDKLYPAMKWEIDLWIPNNTERYFLTITPFNCYFRKIPTGYSPNENDRHVELTRIHRNNMKSKYGKTYTQACRAFIDELCDLELQDEKQVYENKVRRIKEKYVDDINIIEL